MKLGNPNGAAVLRRAGKGGSPLRVAVSAMLTPLPGTSQGGQAWGHTTLRAIVAEINARSILSRRGGRWHVSIVRNLVHRTRQK